MFIFRHFSVSAGFEQKQEYRELILQIENLKKRVDEFGQVVRLDGRKVREVFTAVVAESEEANSSADVTQQPDSKNDIEQKYFINDTQHSVKKSTKKLKKKVQKR